MSLGYRSLLRFPGYGPEIFRLVEQQERSWLQHKRYDPDLIRPGTVQLAGHAQATLSTFAPADASRTRRLRLVEHDQVGAWAVEITTHLKADHSAWVLTDVIPPAPENESAESGTRWTAAPHFMKLLLGAADGQDGLTVMRSEPVVIREDEVDRVIDTICDRQRRGLVLVAGTPDDFPLEDWKTFVGERVVQTVGLAGSYVLDRDATRVLTMKLGRTHAVAPGALRTYLPGADPASAGDALRHRVLTARTLVDRPKAYVQRVLGGSAREHVVDLLLPADVRRIEQLLNRIDVDVELQPALAHHAVRAAAAAPNPPTPVLDVPPVALEPAAKVSLPRQLTPADATDALATRLYPHVRDAVQYVFGDVEPDEATLLELADLALQAGERAEALARASTRADRAAAEAADAKLDVQILHVERDSLIIDSTLDTELISDLLRKISSLQQALCRAGQPEIAYAEEPAQDSPESMSEVLERMDQLRHIEFTAASPDDALAIDERDTVGRIAKKTWLALTVLDDYAEARLRGSFAGGFHAYCKESGGWSVHHHAADESEGTRNNPKFRRPRELPVPVSSEQPTGRVFMGAHFKLGVLATITPRMHYFDDLNGSGKIYVGYIGRHLPNDQTN